MEFPCMRILYVATHLPVPPHSGQSIRSLVILRALASLGHQLSFISFAGKNRPHDLKPLSSFCEPIELLDREVENLTLQKNYLGRLKCLLTFKCYSIERFRSVPMQRSIAAHLSRARYDLIICDSIYGLVNIPETTVSVLMNCHNVEHIIIERYAQIEKDQLKKYYANLESHLMRNAERRGCLRVAAAMVCSETDLHALQQLSPQLPISVIPNVVDTDHIQPVPDRPDSDPAILLFQGSIDWYPNRDAVDFFVSRILPSIRSACPDSRFVVAGRNPPADFVQRFSSDPNIEFTGTVTDMRPYLASATLVVVPLRLGGGTRIKILEACAAGKTVVSTTLGAEGLDLEPGREIVVADEPAEFARSVVHLLRNSELRRQLAHAARAAVVQRYSHSTLRVLLGDMIARNFGSIEAAKIE
jgi:polysaccharide biosynthesis protein PslH